MKLGSLKGGRDGRLVVVSRDLAWCADAAHIAPTLQAALDDWAADRAAARAARHRPRPRGHPARPLPRARGAAPLPRAYQWADGSAYVNHVELVRKARGAEMPESFWTDPLMYQGGSDEMLAPRDADPARRRGLGLRSRGRDRGGDRRRAARRRAARTRWSTIKLVGLVNDVSLRNLIPAELAKGFGFLQSKPASALSPVFVDARRARRRAGGTASCTASLKVDLNGQPFGRADAGEDMNFDFGTLIAHLAKTRNLGAGSIIGSGTVSNRDADGGPGKPVERGGRGYSCIAELRTVETILDGKPATPFLKPGDRVRIWMEDEPATRSSA